LRQVSTDDGSALMVFDSNQTGLDAVEEEHEFSLTVLLYDRAYQGRFYMNPGSATRVQRDYHSAFGVVSTLRKIETGFLVHERSSARSSTTSRATLRGLRRRRASREARDDAATSRSQDVRDGAP
jgi:hypothetical protein